ncbi:MAG: YceI family protein [Bryobacteraceae bacterium]
MAAIQVDIARYSLEPGISRLQVRAFASGMLAGFGHNPTFSVRDFAGEIRIPPGGPAEASLELRVKAASLAVSDDIKDKDRREIEQLMHREVLESAAFPEIAFRSTAIGAEKTDEGQYRITLVGDFFLHGVTAEQQIVAHFSLAEQQARAWGDFTLSQSLFGIRPVSFAGGALKLKDELKLSFDLVARRVQE